MLRLAKLVSCLHISSAIALSACALAGPITWFLFSSCPQHHHKVLPTAWLFVIIPRVEFMASVIDHPKIYMPTNRLWQCLPPRVHHSTATFVCDAVYNRLAQQLMHRAEDRLQRYLQRFLNNIILGNPTDSNLQEDDYHNLIYQVICDVKPDCL